MAAQIYKTLDTSAYPSDPAARKTQLESDLSVKGANEWNLVGQFESLLIFQKPAV